MTELEKQNGLLKVAILALNRAGLTGKELENNGLLIEPFKVKEADKKKQIQWAATIAFLFGGLSFLRKLLFGGDLNLISTLFSFILYPIVIFSIIYFFMNSVWKKRIKLSKEVRILDSNFEIIKPEKSPTLIPFEKIVEVTAKVQTTPELAGIVKIITKGMGVHEIAKMHPVAPTGTKRSIKNDVEKDALKVKSYLDSMVFGLLDEKK